MEARLEPANWEDWIGVHTGPQIVVGGPGSGKTEFLVRRAAGLINSGVEPGSIAVLGFSRRGAFQIGRRIEDRVGTSVGSVASSTFHSLALRIIETFNPDDPPTLLTAPEQVAWVAELLGTEDPKRWPLAYRPILTTSRFAHEVTDFLLRCAEQNVRPGDLDDFNRDDWRGLDEFFARYRASIADSDRIDYGTLMAVAVDVLDHPENQRRVADQFEYVLVDEYQDTSRVQAQFLQAMTRTTMNLTAAADPYQSVFSFRGTDLANVERFAEDFPSPVGTDSLRLVLTTSFRVPKPILAAAASLTRNLDLPGEAGPVTPADGAGRVDVYRFDQATEEAEWVAREIERTHLELGDAYSTMAVFVRTKKRFMAELSRALERRGIPHNRPDSRLADHPTVRMVFDLVSAATGDAGEQNRAMRRIALGTLLRLSPGEFMAIEKVSKESGWAAALTDLGPAGNAVADLVSDPKWAQDQPAATALWHIWDSLPQMRDVANDAERENERFGWASISQALEKQFDRDPSVSLRQYLQWTEKDDFEAQPLLSHRRRTEDEVMLTSLHQAKGLEFQTVFIADAVEGVFPDLRARESLLGSRHLSSSLPIDVVDYRHFRLQEETRLAYTAMTRASRRVVWTATAATNDFQPGGPSRFLELLGLPINPPPQDLTPVSTIEAEAWLRRTAADTSAGKAARLASIENLATAPAWGGRPPVRIAGVLTPGSDHGIIRTGQLFLSPSQADSYDRCPRRYALERRLGFTSGPTVYLSLGSLIHDVIEETDKSHDEPTPQDALAALQARWQPTDFGGPPWSISWFETASDAIVRLYEHRNPANVVLDSERSVELEIEGVLWRGKVDRIEKRGNEVFIVDFKSSKSPPKQEDAAVSIQLGFYVMAAQNDPEIASHGPIAGAEFWYPRKPMVRQPFATRKLDMNRMDEVRQNMIDLAEAVQDESWKPRPGDNCRTCVVRSSCPAMPEGQEAYVS